MAEGGISIEGSLNKRGISRRGLFKIAGSLIGASVISVPVAKWGIEHWSGIEDFFAKLDIAEDIRKGKFNLEKIPIKSFEELKQRILEGMKSLDGLSESQVYLSEGEKKDSVHFNTNSEIFIPASTIKIVICNEAYKMGLNDAKEYLTPQLAEKILRYSDVFDELVSLLPIAQGRSANELEYIVRDILVQAGVPAKNEPGSLPLKVNIKDLFNYLDKMEMPDIMKNAMLQKAEDYERNYGLSTVLLQNLKGFFPAYFKIGLIFDEDSKPPQFVNSYYLQIGKRIKALGYAKGMIQQTCINKCFR